MFNPTNPAPFATNPFQAARANSPQQQNETRVNRNTRSAVSGRGNRPPFHERQKNGIGKDSKKQKGVVSSRAKRYLGDNSEKNRPYGKRPIAKGRNAQPSEIEVLGLERNINVGNLTKYFQENVDINIQVLQSTWKDNVLVLKFGNSAQAAVVKNLSNGNLFFEGKSITIRYTEKIIKKDGPSVVESIAALVKSRYDQNTKFLNLNSIHSDPLYPKGFTGFGSFYNTSKFGPVLCKIIHEQCPDVQTISLESNNIKTLQFFTTLNVRVPNLMNVSFKGNRLSSYKDLEGFNGEKFQHLREVIFLDNPIQQKDGTTKPVDYKSHIKRLFPSIQMLDLEPVLGEVVFNVKNESILPAEVKPNFFDSPESTSTAVAFLESYFEHFDNNRSALINYYAENAIFSLCYNRVSDSKSTANLNRKYDNKQTLFNGWREHDRNLDILKNAGKRVERLFQGPENIANLFAKLPGTDHPIRSSPEKKLFLIDSFQMGGFLYIFVHGEFSVKGGTGKRSFDRTFVLQPALTDSRSARAQIPVSIINEQLIVRTYSTNNAWANAAENVYPQLPDAATLETYKQQFQLQQNQFDIVIEFSKKSGLNFATSLDCLSQSQWDLQKAAATFEAAKPMIPAAAYQV